MSFLSGIMKSIINPATLAQVMMGPAGWASIIAKAAISAIGQQVIQQLGQRLGLPSGIINMAQMAFSAASGTQGQPRSVGELMQQMGTQYGMSAMQQGDLTRQFNTIIDQMATSMSESKEAKEARASGGAKSWIMAIAENLGIVADKLAKEMTDLSQQIGKGDDQAKASTNVKFGAKSQEFSMFFNSANTVIKTLGEALSSGSRKQ